MSVLIVEKKYSKPLVYSHSSKKYYAFAVKRLKVNGSKGKFVGFVWAKNVKEANKIALSINSDYRAFGYGCPLSKMMSE